MDMEKLKNLWKKTDQGKKALSKKEKWILFLLIGVLIAVLFIPIEEKDFEEMKMQENSTEEIRIMDSKKEAVHAYEKELSEKLVCILEQMEGAGKVSAWVTISESAEVVFSLEGTKEMTKLEEADSAGGTRIEETSIVNQSVVLDTNGNPYIIKTIEPKVEGVFVVAEGAGNSTVKKNITEAVEVLFDIDVHRIKVAKKKVEE